MRSSSLREALLATLLASISSLLLLAHSASSPPPVVATAHTTVPVLTRDAGRPHVREHILVQLSLEAAPTGVLPEQAEPVLDRWYTVPVGAGEHASEALARWERHPNVLAAELDQIVHLEHAVRLTTTPNDPLYWQQWNLPAIAAPEAWTRSTGAGVVVAVIDSGVAPGPDLSCHTFVAPYNATSRQQGLAAVADGNGHGTHVAGTVAQCTGNGIGAAGVAFDGSLMPIKACGDDGSCTMADIARGIDWARRQGADVVNLSLGSDCAGVGDGGWPDCSSSVVNQAIDAAAAADIVLVAASGNANQSVVGYPANHPAVIAVGAVDAADVRAPYASYGDALSVVAPGGNIARDDNGDGQPDGVLQETIGAACGSAQPFAYCLFQGTSMASPHVAGVVALLRAATPQADRLAIQQALENTARDLGVSGVDPYYGHGIIDVDAALTALGGSTMVPTPTSSPIAPTTSPGIPGSNTPTPNATPSATPSPTPSSNTDGNQGTTQLYLPSLRREDG